MGYRPRYVLPSRPAKPPELSLAQLRAERLLGPRPPRLKRPELHRDHDHLELTRALNLATLYLHESTGPPSPLPPRQLCRWSRYVLTNWLEQAERSTPDHKWGRLWRINDLKDLWQIDR